MSNCYPVKVPQNCFNSFNCSNQTSIPVFQIFVHTKQVKKADLKFS